MISHIKAAIFHQKWLVFLVFISFSIGLILVFFKGFNQYNFGDAPDYINAATSIFNNTPYLRENLAWPFFRAPGYPFAISSIWTLAGFQGIWMLKVFNVMCHSMSTYLVFRISRFSLSEKQSFLVALFYVFNPFSLLQLSGVQTEPRITCLFLAFVYLICIKPSSLRIFFLALVSVFTIATRPEYLFVIVPILFLSLFLRQFPKGSKLRGIIVIAMIIISLSWWGVQNEKATGSFLPLTDATNFQLWQGSTAVIQQNYPLRTPPSLDFTNDQMKRLVTEIRDQEALWGKDYLTASVSSKSEFWKRAYLENIRENPTRYVKFTLLKSLIFWRPFLNPPSYGLKVTIGSSFVLLPMTLFMIFGIIRYRKQKDSQLMVLSFTIGCIVLTLIHAAQLPDVRYKIPIFVPFATLMAGRLISDWSPMLKSILYKIKLERVIE